MIVFFLVIALLCLWGFGFRREADGDYLSRQQGDSVKGIFILMVFLFHANSYVQEAGYAYAHWTDAVFLDLCAKFGQLIVVMFLFFSGYGVMSAIRNKGAAYVQAMPRHRILTVLVNFDVAVVIFAVLQLLLGRVFPVNRYLLSLVGWEQIGNSNWYIFVILVCYAVTWLSALICKSGYKMLIISVLLLSAFYAVLVHCKEPHWYNTMVAYPLGMAAGLWKDRLDKLQKTPGYWVALVLGFLGLALTYIHHEDPVGLVHSFRSVVFAVVMVLLLMKVKVGNPVLDWAGKNLFLLYIFHRFPMILLSHFDPWGITAGHPVLFVLISFALTLVIVPIVRRIQVRL